MVALLAAALLIVPAFGVASASAAGSEEQQGAQLLKDKDAGKLSCGTLSTTDFERIGEFVMGRMLGTSATHEAMNRQMTLMMGRTGETQAHTFMGRRFAGCGTGDVPTSFGAMMGMMGAGMMGSAYGGDGSGTMMGSRPSGGQMMGFGSASRTADGSGSGWSSGDTVMVILMGLLLALAVGVLVAWRPWRQRAIDTPLETLRARYARGDIDQQEFDRRRQALEGTS